MSDIASLALGGDDIRHGLVVGDPRFDPGNELRSMAPDHLPDAGSELVEEINPGIAANRRTKSFERGRRGSPPIWTVSGGDRD